MSGLISKKHTHLEVACLAEGGYVVTEGRWDMTTRSSARDGEARFQLAGFTTLPEALKWMSKRMLSLVAI